MSRVILTLAILATAASLGAAAASPEKIRSFQSHFIAPCCWHENLAVHDSPLAKKVRADIGAMLARGESEQQVEAQLVSLYGTRILAEPRGRSFWILTVTPIALLLAGLVGLAVWVRSWAHRTRETADIGVLPDLEDGDLS